MSPVLSSVHKPVTLEEMHHNLDFCDILVIGAELDPTHECLELDRTELQGKHLDATNSTAGYSIYGMFNFLIFPPLFDLFSKFKIKCSFFLRFGSYSLLFKERVEFISMVKLRKSCFKSIM